MEDAAVRRERRRATHALSPRLPHHDQAGPGIVAGQHLLEPGARLEPGVSAGLAQADAVAESLPGEDESLAGAGNVEPRAADGPGAEGAAEDGPKLLAAHDRLAGAI